MKQLKFLFVLAALWMAGSIGAWAAVGNTFTAANMNGVDITYKVLTEEGTTGTVQVGDGNYQAISETKMMEIDGENQEVFDIPEGEFLIPQTVAHDGITYTVTAIGDYAFYMNGKTLTAISIPSTVTAIGTDAFYNSGLVSVTLPSVLASLGNQAFGECTALTAIDIPQSVSTIGESCFLSCSQLASVTLHAGNLTVIGNSVFSNSGITSIAIPTGVTSIGESAFCDCSSLQTITLPDGLTSIGGSAFYGCIALEALDIPSSVSQLGSSFIEGCTQLATVTLHEGQLTEISDYTFYKSGVTSISIPEGVTKIGEGAFLDCKSLATAFIPSTVTSIGVYAFYQCDVLQEVTIACDEAPSLPYRREWVFSNSSGKVDVLRIPWNSNYSQSFTSLFASVVEIPMIGCKISVDNRYYRILTLPADEVNGTVQLGAGFDYVGYDGQDEGEVTIASQITYTNGDDSYTFDVTALGEGAFYYASSVGGITIPASVTLIKTEAILSCEHLERIYLLSETPCSLEEDAFSGTDAYGEEDVDYSDCLIIVPAGRKEAYQGSDWGSVFTKFKEVGNEVDWPQLADDQNINPFNKCKALTSITRWTPNARMYFESNMWNMPHMMDGKFYVSAFWQSNNSSDQSEWFNDTHPNFLQLSYNPPELSPNYGSGYYNGETAYGFHDEQAGFTVGGFICFKVKGSGKIVVRGYTESKNAYMAICVEGHDFKPFSGGDKTSEITYTYTLDANAEAYAYVYGASLSPYGRHGYIKNITVYPEGANDDNAYKLAIAGTSVEEGTNYNQGGVSVTWTEGVGGNAEGEEPEGGSGSNLVPIITLTNASLTCATGPAIEVNSYDEVTINLVGDNTASTTKADCAAISIGTTDGGGDWSGCGLVTIGPETEGDKCTLTIPASSSIGLYSNASSLSFNYTTADLSGTEYGLYVNGSSVSNYQTNLKLHGNTSAYLCAGGGYEGEINGDIVESAPELDDDEDEYWYDDETGQYDVPIYEDEELVGHTVATYLWLAPKGSWVEAPLEWSTMPVCNWDWSNMINLSRVDFSAVADELLCYMVTGFDAENLTITFKRVNGQLYNDDRYAVLLYNQTADKTRFHIPYNDLATIYNSDGENKLLRGTGYVNPTEGDYTNFVLTKKDGNYLFRPLGTTRDLTDKGYLPVPTADLPADPSRGFRIVFDGEAPSGIANVENLRMPAQVVFDLLGRQQQNWQHGISVRNGKKVLVK